MIKAIMYYKMNRNSIDVSVDEINIDEESTETALKQAQRILDARNAQEGDKYVRTLVSVELAPVENEDEYAEDDIPDYDLDEDDDILDDIALCGGEPEVLTEEECAERQQALDDLNSATYCSDCGEQIYPGEVFVLKGNGDRVHEDEFKELGEDYLNKYDDWCLYTITAEGTLVKKV